MLEEIFSNSSDFVMREITLGNEPDIKILVAFIDGLVDKKQVTDTLLKPILIESKLAYPKSWLKSKSILTTLQENLLTIGDLTEVMYFVQAVHDILAGDTIIFIDGEEVALRASLKGWESRGVTESSTETVVRGPKESFSETLRINTSLIRRKIINPNLKIEELTLGKQTNTAICIAYIKGIADEKAVDTVRKRLKAINTDAILESGYIEEFIEDAPYSIFPTVGNTEKPDIAVARMLEGRVAILCDGTPFVLTVPSLFMEAFQTGDDYYMRAPFASVIRILRVLAFLISILLPAVYLALVNFNPGVIPFKLLITLIIARGAIPYNTFIELLIMLFTFELIYEAGVRIPKQLGQTVSIVGALVLGEAAVKAGLVSTPIIVITALTAVSSFVVPSLRGVLPFLRIVFLVAASILGILGVMFIGILLFIYMSGMSSLQIPYMSPIAPIIASDLKDTILRFPEWLWIARPKLLTRNKYRMNNNLRKREK